MRRLSAGLALVLTCTLLLGLAGCSSRRPPSATAPGFAQPPTATAPGFAQPATTTAPSLRRGRTTLDLSSRTSTGTSVDYLAEPVQAGWVRSRGQVDGFLVFFETPREFQARGRWPMRFVIINESGHLLDAPDLSLAVHAAYKNKPGWSWDPGSHARITVPTRLSPGQMTTIELAVPTMDSPRAYLAQGIVIVPDQGASALTTTVTVSSR